MSRSVQTLAYARPSALGRTGTDALLGLETSGGSTPSGAEKHPRFFSGFLTSPRAAARFLLAVADVAGARYHQPRPAPSRDPVVTGNGDRLRFESFSACCGVYARLDIGRAGLDGARTGHGTTNYHQVRERAGVLSCTCRWWADHRGGRGPCKHALAVRMARREGAAARPGPVRSFLAGPPGAVGQAPGGPGGPDGHRTAPEGETSAAATGGTR